MKKNTTKNELVDIIASEFGRETADLYGLYFINKSEEESLALTKELLLEIVGIGKTERLLKAINKVKQINP